MAKIGCCSSFKECSKLGQCVQLDNELYNEVYIECYYSENLQKGLNFYTKINEDHKDRLGGLKEKSVDIDFDLVLLNDVEANGLESQVSLFDLC